MAPPASRVLPALLALLAACAPWRSDIELTAGIAAAPILEVQGWQLSTRPSPERRVSFGPWTVERRPGRVTGAYLTLRHDSAVVGTAWCGGDTGPGDPRRKGRWREVPEEIYSCELTISGEPDTLHLEVKADAGHPFTGLVAGEDWSFAVRGTQRLRTRDCLYLPTCGWYVSLDGMDVAAVEADARAWVYISPDLGGSVRRMTALIAGALLLRAEPLRRSGPRMMTEP